MRNRVRFVSAALAIVAMLSAGSGRCRADGPADEALKAAGVRAGLCVDLDVADGRLTAGLHGGGRFLVHGLARDEAGVRKARQFIEGSGLYGPVSVDLRPAGRLPYADNIVNLAVAEDLPGLLAGGLTLEEVARVLAPSGVLCFGGQVDEGRLTAAGLVRRDRAGELEGHASSWPADPTKRVPPGRPADPLDRAGGPAGSPKARWTVATKPRPAAMDDWPCFDYSPQGNPVSRDAQAPAPASLRWRVPMWARHGANVVTAWVSAGGRMFYCYHHRLEDGYRVQYELTARDAYNGQLLWRRPVNWPIGTTYGDRCVVATAERLYLPLSINSPLVALDAATGEVVRTYKDGGVPARVLLKDGTLYMSNDSASWAVDAETAQVKWQQPKLGGPLVLADLEGPASSGPPDAMKRVPPTSGPGPRRSAPLLFCFAYARKLTCLDPADGKVLWQQTTEAALNPYNPMLHYAGTLVLVEAAPTETNKYRMTVAGRSAQDGRELWTFQPKNIFRRGGCFMAEVFGARGLVWVHADVEADAAKGNAGPRPSAWFGLDPADGQVKVRRDDPTSDAAAAKMLANGIHRCNRGRAAENFYLYGTFECFQWATGKYRTANFVRGPCGVGSGLLPANGLVYAPPSTCVCRSFMQRGGMTALANRPGGVTPSPGERLVRGAAFGQPVGAKAAPAGDDWPCYRHDAARSGASEQAVPADLKLLWETPVGRGPQPPSFAVGGSKTPTAPSVAAGTVFLADRDAHQVVAVDAADGRVRWRYTAGGRIDSPPTVVAGLAIFGCRDGRVYAVRADDGRLAWRFQAAPIDERIVVDGRLESAWPVHGSVLATGGRVFFAAGWHTGLDGGVTLYGLAADSGKLLWANRLEKLEGDPRYADVPVALLAGDESAIRMGRWAFDAATGERLDRPPRGRLVSFGVSGFTDNDWSQFSNTKGRLRWSDGRADGELIASGAERSCVVQALTGYGAYRGPQAGRGNFKLIGSSGDGDKPDWTITVPLRMRAMALAGPAVLVAGQHDPEIPPLQGVTDSRELLAIVKTLPPETLDPAGAELAVFSAADGSKTGSVPLPAAPVFDGLAVAGGRVYLSCQDGRLRCFGK